MRGTDSARTRRSFLAGMAGAVGGAIALSCGSGPAGRPATAGSAASKGGEVSFLDWEKIPGTPLEQAIQMFQKQTGTTVTVQPVPTTDYDTKMRTLLAGKVAPDVMRINEYYIRGFSLDNALMDLRPFMKKSGVDQSLLNPAMFRSPTQRNGKHTAWVIGSQASLIFYNVDLFKRAGVPLPPTTWSAKGWTWDDFLDKAKRLTVSGQRWGALVYYSTFYEQTFSVNNGSPTGIYSADATDLTLADPPGTKAVQWATDLTCVHKVQPPWSQLQQPNADLELFVQGKVAMLFESMGIVPYLGANANFTWDVAPPPANVHQMSESKGIVFCIPKSAANPDHGWALLNFLSSQRAGEVLAKGKQFTPINSKAAAMVKQDGHSPAHIELFAVAADHMTKATQPINTLGGRDIYRPALQSTYNCEQPAQKVLSSVRGRVHTELKG